MTAEQNLELHSLMVAAAGSGQVPESLLAVDFVMKNRASSITDYTYRGPSGWRDWTKDLFEEFCSEPKLTIERIVAADDAVVVATYCVAGTSVHNDAPVEFRWSGVTWFADRQATRSIGCTSPEEALEIARRRGARSLDGGPAHRSSEPDTPTPPCGTNRPRNMPVRRRRRWVANRLLAPLLRKPAGDLVGRPLWL